MRPGGERRCVELAPPDHLHGSKPSFLKAIPRSILIAFAHPGSETSTANCSTESKGTLECFAPKSAFTVEMDSHFFIDPVWDA